MLRHARQASRDEIVQALFPYGGSKVTLQFLRLEGESLEIEATLLVRSWNCTESTDGTSNCAVLHLAALRKCRTFVHYYCSVEVFIKTFILPILLFLVQFTAHFACRIAYFFSLPILLNILLANFVKA